MNGLIHPTDSMTSRQRMLAAYRGEQVDRLPYWAKITNATWRTTQPEKVKAMSDLDLLDYIFADGIFYCGHGVRVERPHVSVKTTKTDTEIVTITTTPDGDLDERWCIDRSTGSVHPTVFPVRSQEDIGRYRWVHTDVKISVDPQAMEKARQRASVIGQRGVAVTAWGTSPLMELVEHIIGPEETHIFLHEYTQEMEELMELMHQANHRIADAVSQNTPADIVVSVENTSTTLISPQQFQQYCHRYLCDYSNAIAANGKLPELHMCGHLLKVLPMVETIPAVSIEAFTAPTLGSSRLYDGRTLAPSKTLIGGTNVNTWLMPPTAIQQYIEKELSACPDHRHIVLTTAGVAPPACSLETFRQIGQWLPTLPLRQ